MSRLLGFLLGTGATAWLLSFVLQPGGGDQTWQRWLAAPLPEVVTVQKPGGVDRSPVVTESAVPGADAVGPALAQRTVASPKTTPPNTGPLLAGGPATWMPPTWSASVEDRAGDVRESPGQNDIVKSDKVQSESVRSEPGLAPAAMPEPAEPPVAEEAVLMPPETGERQPGAPIAAGDAAATAGDDALEPGNELPLTWHPLWRSFYSRVSAGGFARHMATILARPLRIRDAGPGEFVVEIGVQSPQQLLEARQRMLATTGLGEQESR